MIELIVLFVCLCCNIDTVCANIQQPGQSYSYEPTGYASSSLAAAPSAGGYVQSELSQPQYAVQGIHSLGFLPSYQ